MHDVDFLGSHFMVTLVVLIRAQNVELICCLVVHKVSQVGAVGFGERSRVEESTKSKTLALCGPCSVRHPSVP